MFENLTSKFEEIFSSLKKAPSLNEAQVEEGLRKIRQALLEADVALPVAKELIKNIKPKAIGQEIIRSTTPGQMIVKVVFDEIVKILGDTKSELNLNAVPPVCLMLVGLQGSGKTTTLYAILRDIDTKKRNVITIEDPIEYQLHGINQIQVARKAGLTFASGLRSILRHDPDQILIGEIRDYETAEIAVQSALTGHLVFSTLHTNDAPSSITRLRDMGIPPFLITATVEAILAQRLVRRICTECRTEFEPSDELLMELQLPIEQAREYKFYYGKGCTRCNNGGYKGRCGIYELLDLTDEIRDLITSDASMGTAVAGIKSMISTSGAPTQWNQVMAAMILTLIPPLTVVLLMQRWFVRGLVDSEK